MDNGDEEEKCRSVKAVVWFCDGFQNCVAALTITVELSWLLLSMCMLVLSCELSYMQMQVLGSS